MTSDPYQDAKQIADVLENVGLSEQSKQIRGALSEGATGTEIYMILRWRLIRIEETSSIPAELKWRMDRLHSFLDQVLGS
ncbi:hypothetical protein AB4Z52_34430 [Rhizobium sp. 2YAF20]|uniref:hypothetical protein n=1 Tax=Rhizobium sp. 2YAF20 TaxID=3233027 RepID=UPI003F972132